MKYADLSIRKISNALRLSKYRRVCTEWTMSNGQRHSCPPAAAVTLTPSPNASNRCASSSAGWNVTFESVALPSCGCGALHWKMIARVVICKRPGATPVGVTMSASH
eukprot:31006-Pelagococcus_subviridis.AAC.10